MTSKHVIESFLPNEISGKHWLEDRDEKGHTTRLASIEATDDKWKLTPYGSTTIKTDDKSPPTKEACSFSPKDQSVFYELHLADESVIYVLIQSESSEAKTFTKIGYFSDTTITVGKAKDNIICYPNEHVLSHHASFTLEDLSWTVKDHGSRYGTYLNGMRVKSNTDIKTEYGDVIYIMGLKITIGLRFLGYSSPHNTVMRAYQENEVEWYPQDISDEKLPPYEPRKKEVFFRSPRIMEEITLKSLTAEDPPSKKELPNTPTILKIGPSIGMALGSAIMALFMVSTMLGAQDGASNARAIPMLGTMVIMISGAILWPNLSSRYEKKKAAKEESQRRATYALYLDSIRRLILKESALQKRIYEQNRITVAQCTHLAYYQDRRLFERTPLQSDFLELRIGLGEEPLKIDLSFPQDKLSIEEDLLKNLLLELKAKKKVVSDVPLAISLVDDFILGIVTSSDIAYPFLRGLIVQICTLHAPDEVKIVYLGDEQNKREWKFVSALPHIFSDNKDFRYLATTKKDAQDISLRLKRELQGRLETNRKESPLDYGTYYVVIDATSPKDLSADIITSLCAQRQNKGFSVITLADDIRSLPKESRRIIELSKDDKGHIKGTSYNPKEASQGKTSFTSDIALGLLEAKIFSYSLLRVVFASEDAHTSLPKSLGFLEMFEAAQVEHLNIKTRWRENDPTLLLGVPLGIDSQGNSFVLDVHEEVHGPHGLIAGMTGSGKSEIIITWVLSLAINYRPDEVSFVLIDYKGGGLAGAFDNSKARLPHLAGTITNLDGSAITRSLVSIQSELKRRQSLFNIAREAAGTSTIDIYKYQRLYRQGVINEPCTHLFIIADEFAELKSQEPDFMDQLISTARIGRSLGVHLILATQKPSGVVNDQIWSNARFKICLKVADAADSKEMLKRPDAAELTDAGRAYLMVGYNESFSLGQIAYAGAAYMPSASFEPPKDDALVMVSNTARPLAQIKPEKKGAGLQSLPESVAVLDHLVAVAKEEGLKAPRLWLDPLPEHITIDELIKKYDWKPTPFVLDPVIGEYDDPASQRQGLLTLPLSAEGNAIIYGSAGCGKATFIITMLTSLLKVHSAQALNVYILDFGAETLGTFIGAPQVGDVLLASDEEKMEMLIKTLSAEVQARRKGMSDFDGNFVAYSKATQTPTILVVINVFEIFCEIYDKYINDLTTLTRDGLKYGIQFVLSTSRANGVSYRILPNFKLLYVLQFNNRDSYLSVLGSLKDVEPPTSYARGLVKMDRVFEFQTARIGGQERGELAEVRDLVADECSKAQALSHENIVAPPVPSLPSRVTPALLLAKQVAEIELVQNAKASSKKNLDKIVPFGINKEGLELASFNFSRSPVAMVLSEDEQLQMRFLRNLLEVIEQSTHLSRTEVLIIDPDDVLDYEPKSKQFTYYTDPKDIDASLSLLINEELDACPLLVLVSLKSLYLSLGDDVKDAFLGYIKDGKIRNLAGMIISGEPSRFSQFNYEGWFKELVSHSNGVWLGEGVNSQSTLKVIGIIPSSSASLSKNYTWFINGGTPKLVKHVVCENEDEDE